MEVETWFPYLQYRQGVKNFSKFQIQRSHLKSEISGARKKAQLVKCLQYKREDLSLDRQDLLRKPDASVTPSWGRREQEDSLRQCSQLASSSFKGETLSQKTRLGRANEEDNQY